MRMTVKGQVTVPLDVRRKLDLKPGDHVEFVEDGDRVVFLKPTADTRPTTEADFAEWLGGLIGVAKGGPSTDAFLDAVRDRKPVLDIS